MTSKELRRKYIDFFVKKGHIEIPSASVMPENDPSTLFTTAGMHPLVPFLMGEKHPAGQHLVNSQKCIRTGDIDEVGNKTHHTFFEMLGHWSLGGYWKEEAIKMSYEFLTSELGLDSSRLAFSVFAGDPPNRRAKDEEAAQAWKFLGIPKERIAYLPKDENWWEQKNAVSGPCGPCTEMFYWTDKDELAPIKFDPEDKRWVEIGNDVLMQYEKKGENKYVPASQKNIDNGTGLERLLAVINGLDDNYLTDLFKPIIEKIEKLSNKKYTSPQPSPSKGEGEQEHVHSMRIIADHLRAATFIIGDDLGIVPSNVDQGYVVRKLIRRAIRHGRLLGISDNCTAQIGEVIIKIMSDTYPELDKNKKFILDNLQLEEEKFTKTLQSGLKEFAKLAEQKNISGKQAFNLFQTYGFPLELTQELAQEKGISIDVRGFEEEFVKHQELSRTASAGKFKGGLADHSEQVIKYHTAAHLLLEALRRVLGDHVIQKGSNITEERLRLDFFHSKKLTDEQKQKVEDSVNNWINQKLEVNCQEMSLEQAQNTGAMGVFANKYGSQVKVYTVGDNVSKEICGGPHVKNTGELGKFKIKKEESSSAGVRRIKAILE